MVPVEILIFDFDGTLVSSGEDLVAAVNHTLCALSLPERPEKEILGFIGDGVDTLIGRSLGGEQMHRHAEAMAIFSPYYETHMLDRTRLYPGVVNVLEHFADKKKLIVTNKRHAFTVKIARQLGILSYFNEVFGRDSHRHVKPDPRLLTSILEKYGVSADRAAMIGDGTTDLIMAKGAGVRSCAHLAGLTDPDLLRAHGPDFTYENIEEIVNYFS